MFEVFQMDGASTPDGGQTMKRSRRGESAPTNDDSEDGHDKVFVKMLVPQIAVGSVLGKGGEAIIEIQKRVGGKCRISKQDEVYPGTTSERVCALSGPEEAVLEIIRYIHRKIRDKPDPNTKVDVSGRPNPNRHKQVLLVVPNSTAGLVIGKGGFFIKEVNETTHAHAVVANKNEDFPNERVVKIDGEEDEVNNAVELIVKKVKEDSNHAAFPELNYPPSSHLSSSLQNSGSGGVGGGTPMSGGPMMPPSMMSPFSRGPFMPGTGPEALLGYGGMLAAAAISQSTQSLPPALDGSSQAMPRPESLEKLRGLLDASRYVPAAQDEIIHALVTLARHNLLPGVGLNNDVITSLLVSLSAVGCLHELSNQQSDATFPGQQSSAMFSGGAVMPFSGGNSGSGTAGGGSGAGGEGDDEIQIRREISVEDALVGVILGPGGRGLREIARASGGVHITVSHRSEGDTGQPRMVALSGTMTQVDRAQRFVEELIQNEKRRRQRVGASGQKRKA